MVRNSTKTYGETVLEARAKTDYQSVGETLEALMPKFKEIIDEAVQKSYDAGIKGKYYIHIWVQKDPYAQNALHIYPQCRRTRPSPYQGHDHYLWSVENQSHVKFEWCIPCKEQLNYILANPHKFDPEYVSMLKKYTQDKLEKLDDYLVDGKVI